MAVPDYETLMRPVLETLAELGAFDHSELYEAVAKRLNLNVKDKTERLP